MYSIRNILKQQPSSISSAVVISMNTVLVFFKGVHLTADQVSLLNLLMVTLLSLFYVRPLTASKDELNEMSKTNGKKK